MKDGYYLSTYLEIDRLRHLLKSSARHDHNLSLFKKTGDQVELIRYWELERITGVKNHNIAFYSQEQARDFINELLQPLHLSLADINEIWGTPGLQTHDDYHSIHDFPDYSYHNIAHLFSAIMLDSEKFYHSTILALALDAGPDILLDHNSRKKIQFAGCFVREGHMELFPVESPGCMWFWVAQHYRMREGTLMALASACQSESDMDMPPEIPMSGWGFNQWMRSHLKHYIDAVEDLASQQSDPSCSDADPNFSDHERKMSMVMKKVQQRSLEMVDETIEGAIERYNIHPQDTYVAMSGGYALNCPTNSHIMGKFGFKGLIAPPCVNDGGISLGIGLYAFYKKHKGRIRFQLSHPSFGETDHSVRTSIRQSPFASHVKSIGPADEDQAVDDIIQSPVVWFQGSAEIGPRALGNRSILGDPRTNRTKEILNLMKKRQWWRPVAPVIMEEHVQEWFEDAYPSPYMLHTFTIKADKRELVPAIAHLDYTARVQTVNSETNPILHGLLLAFYRRTGVPLLCNTSLNDNEEPIINRVDEALNFALRKGISALHINGERIELLDHERYPATKPHPRKPFLVSGTMAKEELDAVWRELNPYEVSHESIANYFVWEADAINIVTLQDEQIARKIARWGKMFYSLTS
ncbi:carbamoyltransferase C-terminal domain-containing protein [Paenibacillus sp. SYP-B4298]|uniref:carbamoyltransferase C-terminal domain-containing protein n=1 Tax=Paenibacillus sp. SYP-B4298 TaxID=2996034 RepID=UPI0022DD30FF|nr:carbamoyltransferase C-terminal domain-containing protein [Paenibacillus sp. SYP-B4298]